MALVIGTNSYTDVAFADAYALDREGTDDFINLFEEDKEKLLVSATDFLDTITWVGEAAATTQALAWPRNATYYDPKIGAEVTISNETPEEIKEAQVELAIYFVANGSFTGTTTSSSGDGPDRIKVGSIEIDGLKTRDNIPNMTLEGVEIPFMVKSLIDHLFGVTPTGSGLFKPTFRAW